VFGSAVRFRSGREVLNIDNASQNKTDVIYVYNFYTGYLELYTWKEYLSRVPNVKALLWLQYTAYAIFCNIIIIIIIMTITIIMPIMIIICGNTNGQESQAAREKKIN
jgi:hypothetical protein